MKKLFLLLALVVTWGQFEAVSHPAEAVQEVTTAAASLQ
jgi:hypothetical protein